MWRWWMPRNQSPKNTHKQTFLKLMWTWMHFLLTLNLTGGKNKDHIHFYISHSASYSVIKNNKVDLESKNIKNEIYFITWSNDIQPLSKAISKCCVLENEKGPLAEIIRSLFFNVALYCYVFVFYSLYVFPNIKRVHRAKLSAGCFANIQKRTKCKIEKITNG